MHKVFISYHHRNDQASKELLLLMNTVYPVFEDCSVNTREIDDDLDDQTIRQKIRDDYLRDSTVTILLVGTETKKRKHVDWEIYSSMHDGKINKRSGILVVNLPTTNCTYYTAAHKGEKERVYPEESSWMSIDSRAEYQRRYPYMPDRIIDNLLKPKALISVVNWDKIENDFGVLEYLIETAYRDRLTCEYDLSRAMKRRNS